MTAATVKKTADRKNGAIMRNENYLGSVKPNVKEHSMDEKDLIEEIRREAAWEEGRMPSPAAGVAAKQLLYDFCELGYTAETVQLLFLVPAVQVAWAEGWVAQTERKLVLEAARLRGLDEGSPEYQKLSEWLRDRPPDHLFELALVVIGAILSVLRPDERASKKNDVLSLCARVAKASGLMGFLKNGSKVTREERQLLKHIMEQLEQPAVRARRTDHVELPGLRDNRGRRAREARRTT